MIDRYIYLIIFFIICIVISFIIVNTLDNIRMNIFINRIADLNKEDNNYCVSLHRLFSNFYYNKDEIEAKLNSAGIYNEFIGQFYYIAKLILVLLSFAMIGSLFFLDLLGSIPSMLFLLSSLFIFVLFPDMYIENRSKKNIKHISSRLPFLLDLMNVCVQTGMTIESSLEYLAKELETVDTHLARIVTITSERSKLVGLQKSLEEFYELVPTSESQSFVMTLIQSIQFGSSIGSVLSTLAKDIREINIMTIEEKIGKMGTKMSIPLIVFIMVPIVVLIAVPGIMRMLMS